MNSGEVTRSKLNCTAVVYIKTMKKCKGVKKIHVK